MRPALKWTIAALMAATAFRTQTILFLPTLEMFGGPAPDGWLGPWLSDTLLGLLVPLMLFLFWARRGIKLWSALVIYNAVGAFDYSQGLIAQYVSPMPVEIASSATVYGGIAVFMSIQLVALSLLFRREAMDHFLGQDASPAR